MRMEELNKNQIVLLTLLISFVTSIATGIVTVTLMDQAPKGVTQTINRIVERTIEKVVPGQTQTATVIKEVPVIVTEEDLIVNAITNSLPGVVKIVDAAKPEVFLGSGFIASEDGLIITLLSGGLATSSSKSTLNFSAVLADGQIMLLKKEKSVTSQDQSLNLFRLQPTAAAKFSFLELADGRPSIGQTVLALGAPLGPANEPNVEIGKVSALIGQEATTTASSSLQIKTGAVNQNNLGAPLLNTKGKVIGLSRGAGGLAVDRSLLKELLTAQP